MDLSFFTKMIEFYRFQWWYRSTRRSYIHLQSFKNCQFFIVFFMVFNPIYRKEACNFNVLFCCFYQFLNGCRCIDGPFVFYQNDRDLSVSVVVQVDRPFINWLFFIWFEQCLNGLLFIKGWFQTADCSSRCSISSCATGSRRPTLTHLRRNVGTGIPLKELAPEGRF